MWFMSNEVAGSPHKHLLVAQYGQPVVHQALVSKCSIHKKNIPQRKNVVQNGIAQKVA